MEAAKSAHAVAARFFEQQRYERAIELWRAAYELDCSAHALLINIARAHEKAGDEQAAEDVYELYLERAGAGADPAMLRRVGRPAPVDHPAPAGPAKPPNESGNESGAAPLAESR